MTTHTETHQLDIDLTLRDPSHSPLSVHAITLSLTKEEDTLLESRLTFQVTPELYQGIDKEALFNLKPELRGFLQPENSLANLISKLQRVSNRIY